jgi:hypothetical protein
MVTLQAVCDVTKTWHDTVVIATLVASAGAIVDPVVLKTDFWQFTVMPRPPTMLQPENAGVSVPTVNGRSPEAEATTDPFAVPDVQDNVLPVVTSFSRVDVVAVADMLGPPVNVAVTAFASATGIEEAAMTVATRRSRLNGATGVPPPID